MSRMLCKNCLFKRREPVKLKRACENGDGDCTPLEVLKLCLDNKFTNEKVILSMICGITIKSAKQVIANYKN